jgi:uncharacterized membrane protein YtjA (UPF0391 family)
MLSIGLELLIAALVAATFGFGGVETPLTLPARALAMVLFVGFGYCLVISLHEARHHTKALRSAQTGDATMRRAPLTP